MADISYTYTYVTLPVPPGGLIERQPGNAFVPLDLDNMDYQAFLAWMAEGNPAPQGWTGPTNQSG